MPRSMRIRPVSYCMACGRMILWDGMKYCGVDCMIFDRVTKQFGGRNADDVRKLRKV
jgi:hypothetical protein